jgi:hypothetical protein
MSVQIAQAKVKAESASGVQAATKKMFAANVLDDDPAPGAEWLPAPARIYAASPLWAAAPPVIPVMHAGR